MLQKPPAILFENPHGDVGQDIYPPARIRTGSPEPETAGSPAEITPKRHGSETRKTQQIAARVKPQVKEEIKVLAVKKHVSESAVVAMLVERGLAQTLGEALSVTLTEAVSAATVAAVASQVQLLKSFLRWLLIRIAYDSNQTRSLVTSILVHEPHLSKQAVEHLLRESAKAAKENIFGQSPQLTELILEFDHVMAELAGEKTRV